MFLLLATMLSGALGQQIWSLRPLAPQRNQLQNAPVLTSRSQKAFTSTQLQTQNHLRNFEENYILTIHRPQGQKQSSQSNNVQIPRHENEMRHRDLSVASTVYQNVVNRARNTGASKRVLFTNSNRFQAFRQSSTILNKQQYDTSISRHSSSPLHSVLSHGQEQLSEIQPITQTQMLKLSQLAVLAVVPPRPSSPMEQNVPENLSNINTSNRTILEPVLAFETTLQPAQGFVNEQFLFPIAKSANDVFLECCRRENIDVKCESRCNFDIIDRKVLTAMFLGADLCPRSNGRMLLACAAQGSDHTNCCRANGVQRTVAGDKCLLFCQITTELKFQLDISMLPCWSILNKIKQCFRRGLIEQSNNIQTDNS